MTQENTVYVRNLPSGASRQEIFDFFRRCDHINQFEIMDFAYNQGKYVKITFVSSRGVVDACKLNGIALKGVPISVSVTDPNTIQVSANNTFLPAGLTPHSLYNANLIPNGIPGIPRTTVSTGSITGSYTLHPMMPAGNIGMNSATGVVPIVDHLDHSGTRYDGNLSGNLGAYNIQSARSIEQLKNRTIHVQDMNANLRDAEARIIFSHFGTIVNYLEDLDTQGFPYSLIEYESELSATEAIKQGVIKAVEKEIIITASKIPINPITPADVSLSRPQPIKQGNMPLANREIGSPPIRDEIVRNVLTAAISIEKQFSMKGYWYPELVNSIEDGIAYKDYSEESPYKRHKRQ